MLAHKQFLQNTLISDMIGIDHKPSVVVHPETSLRECLGLMESHNFRTLPVYDSHNNQFVGLLDVFNVLLELLSRPDSQDPSKFAYFFETLTCADIKLSPLCAFQPEESVWNFMKLDARQHCQRCLVTQKKCFELTTFLFSEFDLMKYLVQHPKKLGSIAQESIENLHVFEISKKKFVLLPKTMKSIEAFRVMMEEGVRVAGIVEGIDEMIIFGPQNPVNESFQGKLVGSLSASDFRSLTLSQVDKFFEPIEQFLKNITVPITCTRLDTLHDVMLKSIGSSTHQVWVVNAAMKPIGFIELSDMLNVLVEDKIATPALTIEKMISEHPTQACELKQA